MNVSSTNLLKMLEDRKAGEADFLLVDVREYHEYEAGRIDGVDRHLPMSSFSEWGEEFFNNNMDKKIIFTCRSGNRSGQIERMFEHNGHKNVYNHVGGIISYGGKIVRGL